MDKENPKTKHRRRRFPPAKIAAAAVLLAVCAGLLYAYLRPDSLRALQQGEGGGQELFTYEAGSGQTFAAAGDALAVASSTGIQLIGANGETILRKIFSMDEPAVAACGDRAAFYDVGGTTLRVVELDGTYTTLDTTAAILSVTLNEEGYMAVAAEETGYKGLVTIYNPQLQAVYRWHSGEGYLLKAEVSPNSKGFAALTLASTGGRVQFFSLGEEDPLSTYEAADTLLLDMKYCGDRVCALSETGLVFLEDDGTLAGSFDFGGESLVDYHLGTGDFAAVCLSEYRAGGTCRLVTLDGKGSVLGQQEIRQDLVGLDICSKQLLLQYSDTLELYDRRLFLQGTADGVLGIQQAILREKGDALLLRAYSAELCQF